MLAQISLLLSASLLWLACTFDPSAGVKEANKTKSMSRPWDEHTLESNSKTISTKFVAHPESEQGKKEICVALEVEKNSELNQAYNAMVLAHQGQAGQRHSQQRSADFLTELLKAKILCVSRYRDNRTKTSDEPDKKIIRHMSSYFDGKTSHRVHCYTYNNEYQCRDREGDKKYKITNLDPFLKNGQFKRVTDSILAMEKRDNDDAYSQSRKILRVSSSWLIRDQKAFHPVLSRERAEYKYENVTNSDGHQQKLFRKVIDNKDLVSAKTGEAILPTCIVRQGSDGSPEVTGFKKVKECVDELTPWGRYCKFWSSSKQDFVSNENEINACKLTGRGIIIEQADNTLLRVSACKYQPASQHFYCSGKLETTDPSYKVYFERYGVDISEEQNKTCPTTQTLLTGRRGTLNNVWNKSTTDSPSSTFNNGFVSWGPSGFNKNQHCFALDIEQNGELRTAWRENRASHDREKSEAYLLKASLAKVLCISKYKVGSNDPEYMYSYYTGGANGKAHRANCWKTGDKDFVCRDEKGDDHTLISKADVNAEFGGGNVVSQIIDIEYYDEDKKIMRMRGRHLANKQIARFPYVSKEMPEYDYRDVMIDDRDQRRYVKVIEAIKSSKNDQDILSECENSGGSIAGFQKIKACDTEFGIYNHFCDGNDEVNVCKLGGRGILIKEADGDILRVTACEHQPAAGHFYCSGKIDNERAPDGELKMYFERYGVYTEKVDIRTVHSCPDTKTIVRDTNSNSVPIEVEEESSTTTVGGVGMPTETTSDCQADTAIDDCECKLLIHGGWCLSKCPDSYTQTGTGCMKDETTPPSGGTTGGMTPSTPDCSNGMRTADCNCVSPMYRSGSLCCDADKHVVGANCVVKPDCSNGMRTAGCNNCNHPMYESGGLCCDKDKHNVGGACVPITPTCEETGVEISNCNCAGKIYDNNCYNVCPAGTSEGSDNMCIKDPVRCSSGEDRDNCDVCVNEIKTSSSTRCCEEQHTTYDKDEGCQNCRAPQEGEGDMPICE